MTANGPSPPGSDGRGLLVRGHPHAVRAHPTTFGPHRTTFIAPCTRCNRMGRWCALLPYVCSEVPDHRSAATHSQSEPPDSRSAATQPTARAPGQRVRGPHTHCALAPMARAARAAQQYDLSNSHSAPPSPTARAHHSALSGLSPVCSGYEPRYSVNRHASSVTRGGASPIHHRAQTQPLLMRTSVPALRARCVPPPCRRRLARARGARSSRSAYSSSGRTG